MAVTKNSIITPQTPRGSIAVTTTTNTNYTDTPTNTQVLWTAGPNGSRITKITSLARASTSATEMQLFRSIDGGTTKRYFDSKSYLSFSMSQTVQNNKTDWGYSDSFPLMLAPNEILYVAQGVTLTAGMVTVAEGADF